MTDEGYDIKVHVRERYGERARQVTNLNVLNVVQAAC